MIDSWRWTVDRVDALLACNTDEELRNAFPNHTLSTLKRAQRQYRKEGTPKDNEAVRLLPKLQEALERAGVPEEAVGSIRSIRAGTHEMGSKDAEGNPQVTQLSNVQFVIDPIFKDGPKWPVVQPARPVSIHPVKVKPNKSKYKTAVILPDPQIGFWRDMVTGELDPFHDERAMSVALQVARDLNPDLIVNLGDFLDFPEFGKFEQTPTFGMTTQATIDRGYKFFAEQKAVAPNAHIVLLQGNHECLDDQTRAVTQRGLVPYNELTTDDFVYTIDENRNTKLEKVQKVHIYDYEGEMYGLRSQNVDYLVTPNHRLVGENVFTDKLIEFHPISAPHTSRFITSALNTSEEYGISDDEIRLAVWMMTDSHHKIVGNYSSWTFYQAESKAERIRELLNRLGVECRENRRQRDIKEICGKKLLKKSQAGVEFYVRVEASRRIDYLSSSRKTLPKFFWELSPRQRLVAIEEWVYTDGTIPTNAGDSRVIYCSSILREELLIWLITSGHRAGLTQYAPGYWRINIALTRTKSKVEIKKKSYKQKYSGKVWCVTVPSGMFFVERGGKVHLTGNSRLQRSIINNAKAAFGLKRANDVEGWPVLSVQNLLRVDELGVEYIDGYPAGEYWINDRIKCIHGHIVRSNGSTAKAVSDDERVSTVFGHKHSIELHYKTVGIRNGLRTNLAFTPGCLCRIDGAVPPTKSAVDVMGRPVKTNENWQQGLGVVSYIEGDGEFSVELVYINEGTAIFRGKKFTA